MKRAVSFNSGKNTVQKKALSTVAVFGGSFNPLHEGHLGIIRALAADAEVGWVLVVPTHRSPFKEHTPLLPGAVRWAMLRESLGSVPGVALCDLELRRPPPSYTSETLHVLSSLLPRARLMLAVGWDVFQEFARWHQAEEILRVAGLLVFDRAGIPPEGLGAPETWAALLPPPWPEQCRRSGPDRLVDADGRVLLRHLPLTLPDLSARKLLQERSLDGVPAGAREVLAAYWGRPAQG